MTRATPTALPPAGPTLAQLRLAGPAPLLHYGPEERAEADRLVREQLLRHVLAGLYVPWDVPDTAALRAAAAAELVPLALCRGAAVLCWDVAAWVWSGGPTPDRVDVAVLAPANRAAARPPLAVHQMRAAPRDVRLVGSGPVLVTGIGRTAVDLARRLPVAQALAVLDALEQHADLTPALLLARLAATPPCRDITRARRTADVWVSRRGPLTPTPAASPARQGQSPRVPVTR
jgi:hypothetical protein